MDSLKIRINGTYTNGIIDLTDDDLFPFELKKGLFDFVSLTSRTGEESTTFTVPCTSDNGKTLDHIYSTNTNQFKDTWQKIDCEILVNDEVFEIGKFKVKRTTNKKGISGFDCAFISNNTIWIEKLQDIYMNELEYDSTAIVYNMTNVKASHSNTYADEYVFTPINRGQRKYQNAVHTEDCFPDLFLIPFLEKCFNKVGYTVGGSWIADADVRKLIISYFGLNFKLTDAETTAEYARGQLPTISIQVNPFYNNPQKYLITKTNNTTHSWDTVTSPNSDAGGNVSTDEYVIPFNGVYKFNLSVTVNTKEIGFSKQAKCSWHLKKTSGGVVTYYQMSGLMGSGITLSTASPNDSTFVGESFTLPFLAGDIVEFAIEIEVINGNNFTVRHTTDTYFEAILTDKIMEGMTFNINNILDDTIPVVELIEDIIKLGNLVPRADENIKKVYLETFDNFINNLSTATDYTSKIDISKALSIEKISDTYKRRMSFKFAKDSNDKYLAQRNKIYGNIAGDETYDISEDIEEGIDNVELKHFAFTYHIEDKYATPTISVSGTFPNFQYNYTPPLWNSRIWQEFSTEPPKLSTDHNPRLLYYNYTTQQDSAGVSRKIFWHGDSVASTQIPTALVHPIIVNGVTNIAIPLTVMWADYDENNRGLVYNYYRKQLQRVEEGLRVECIAYIDNVDYANMTFRTPIYLDIKDFEGFYIIENIEGFKPHKTEPCKVTLLTHANYSGVSISQRTFEKKVVSGMNVGLVGGGVNNEDVGSGFDNTGNGMKVGSDNNNVANMNQLLWGDGLTGGAKVGQVILGQYNKVDNDAIFIIGDGTPDTKSNSLLVKSNGEVLIGGGYDLLTQNENEYVQVYTLNSDGKLIRATTL